MGNRLRIFSIQIELRPVILSLVSVLFLSFYSAVAFSAENPPPPPAPVANDVAVPTQTDAVKTMRKDGEHPVWDATHKIGTITILNRNVFDLTNPSENGWIGKLGDKIHIITRERTIRNELLFKEGEPYNARLIDETARNLRAKSYLTEVEITSFKGKAENTVDVVVTSRDQWTLLVGTTFGGTNQNQMYGLDFGEKNLFGLGQTISYSIRQDNSGMSRSIGFSDPNIMGSRYAASLGYSDTPFETDRNYLLQHPFYSLETDDAYGVSYNTRDHAESGLSFVTERFLATYALGFDRGSQVYRPALTLSLGTQRVTVPVPTVVTLDNKLELSMALLDDPRNYSKDSYVQKFRQTEDIPLGTTYNFLGGQSMTSFGSTSTYTTESFQVTKWTRFFSRDYLYAGFSFTQNDDNFNKELISFQTQYYYRYFLRQTFFLNVQTSYLESDVNRLALGGTSGLRGYPVNAFKGRNQVLLNFEDRIYTYKSIFSGIIEPGFVLFVDGGDAWNNNAGDTYHGLHPSFGAGLRIALVKAPGISVVQIDYGVPFDTSQPPVISLLMSGTF